jgi:hypothetical protein
VSDRSKHGVEDACAPWKLGTDERVCPKNKHVENLFALGQNHAQLDFRLIKSCPSLVLGSALAYILLTVFFVLSVESFGDDTTTSLITASLLVPTEGIAAVAATKGM